MKRPKGSYKNTLASRMAEKMAKAGMKTAEKQKKWATKK